MKAPNLQVLIVDDDTARSTQWATKIQAFGHAGLKVSALDFAESKKVMETAIQRQVLARSGVNPFDQAAGECGLDSVDILIIDYDLQELLSKGQWSTGLQVATLARAFTRVKLIVLVNQFSTNNFDLTLSKAVESHSDFDVGSDQILNPSLWDRNQIGGFSPWAWCDGLLRAPSRYEEAVGWTVRHLDKPVLKSLGFDSSDGGTESPMEISNELWEKCLVDPKHTFRELVKNSEFLTPKDREIVVSFDETCARVAASIVLHWLDRWVIPANEVLIDLPHLASAYPWLLQNKMTLEGWQASAHLVDGFRAFRAEVLKHKFSPGFATSRPVVWKRMIAQNSDLVEPKGFTYSDFPDLVFCEDTSGFQLFSDAKAFSSRLPGGDSQRFVADPEKVPLADAKYFPLVGVTYEPSVLFAL